MSPQEKLIVERLKATYADIDEMEKVFSIVTKILALREAELSQAKALCARAANVLEIINKGWPIEELGLDAAIIAELRKAAE